MTAIPKPSQPVPAEVAEARKDFLRLLPPNPEMVGSLANLFLPRHSTFSTCCGSQYMISDGHGGAVIPNGGTTAIPLTGDVEKYAEDYMEKHYGRYGKPAREYLGESTYKTYRRLVMRRNGLGITAAVDMDLKKAIDILYPDPEMNAKAHGYEIKDEDSGQVVNIIWTDA